MVGRIPVMEVSSSTTVGTRRRRWWGNLHRQRAGVPRGPRCPQCRRGPHRPRGRTAPRGPMTKDKETPTCGPRRSPPTRRERGRSRSRVVRPDRHLAAQRRDQDPRRHRRELMFTEGVLLLERVAAASPAAARAAHRRGRDHRPEGRPRPHPARYAAGVSPRSTRCSPPTGCATWSPPRGRTALRRPGACALRLLVRVLPRSEGAYVDPATGKVVSGAFATAAKRLDAVAEMGFDILYLPPIHPIGKVNRKGPNNTPGDRGGRPRLAVGDRLRRGRPRRDPPRPRHVRGLRRLRRARRRAGLEVALDLALQAAPTTCG